MFSNASEPSTPLLKSQQVLALGLTSFLDRFILLITLFLVPQTIENWDPSLSVFSSLFLGYEHSQQRFAKRPPSYCIWPFLFTTPSSGASSFFAEFLPPPNKCFFGLS